MKTWIQNRSFLFSLLAATLSRQKALRVSIARKIKRFSASTQGRQKQAAEQLRGWMKIYDDRFLSLVGASNGLKTSVEQFKLS